MCGGEFADTEVDMQAYIMHAGTYTNMHIDAYARSGVYMLYACVTHTFMCRGSIPASLHG